MLKIQNISFNYPNSRPLFNGLNFDGTINGLIKVSGANGVGKTTFLKIIGNLITPKEGTISYKGEPLYPALTSYLSAKETAFFNQLTGQEGLDLFCRLNRTTLDESLASLFIECSLYSELKDSQFHQMSSGMKRFFLILLSFTKPADVFLLDEPFSALDKKTKGFLIKTLNMISKSKLIFVVSHEENHELHLSHEINLEEIQKK